MDDPQITRFGRIILLRVAVKIVDEGPPEHREEVYTLAQQYLRIDQNDSRLGPDQGQRVRSALALAARAST